MKKKLCCFLSFFLLCLGPVFALPVQMRTSDIPRVMERFFAFHIETHDYSPALLRRSFKLYLEQFDADKSYLLESEALPYINMSEEKLSQVAGRLRMGDYSDFFTLNQVLQKATLRAQTLRSAALADLLKNPTEGLGGASPSRFARSEAELTLRQKARMSRFFAYHQVRTNLDTADRRAKVFTLFEKKVRRSENNYLFLTLDGQVLPQAQIQHLMAVRMIKCFAKGLDTHSSFFSPEEAYEMRLSLEKQFDGVGVVLSESIDGVMIAELIDGSPAAQSQQIQVNDYLVEIDGQPTGQKSFEEVLDMLKKKDRGELILGFKRVANNKETFFRVPLAKRPIVMNEQRIQTSVEQVEGGIIGKISLHSFYETSDGQTSERDIKEAIRSFHAQGELKGLVLDLRENSGGFLSQAVKVTGLFVSNGVMVISKYGTGEMHYLRNVVGKSFYSGPLVVLTSKMSASAAEIVAQALQDYGVALIVGDKRTFGKGSIQFQTVTDNQAEYFFKVTVGRYYTVSGKSTQIEGVVADIEVPTPYAPYNIGERYLEYPLQPDRVEAAYTDPLSDLDEKTQYVFQKRYLPYLQRVVSFWKQNLPELRQKSAARLAQNPGFQQFLKKQEQIRAQADRLPPNSIDEHFQGHGEDFQMKEATSIVRDMIHMEAQEAPHSVVLQATGSDD